MFTRSVALFALTLTVISLHAQQSGWQPSPGHTQIPIWPDGVPDASANTLAEADLTKAKDPLIAGKPLIHLGNVSVPTITLYKPASASIPAPAVVVFPGGGYNILAIDLEGTEVCTAFPTPALIPNLPPPFRMRNAPSALCVSTPPNGASIPSVSAYSDFQRAVI